MFVFKLVKHYQIKLLYCILFLCYKNYSISKLDDDEKSQFMNQLRLVLYWLYKSSPVIVLTFSVNICSVCFVQSMVAYNSH